MQSTHGVCIGNDNGMINNIPPINAFQECRRLDISFHLCLGPAKDHVPELAERLKAAAVVTDFSPLRVPQQWVASVAKALPDNIPLYQVDTCLIHVALLSPIHSRR